MSLTDALFLDPAPFNVWIAVRTDGIKGSGTASDPYDGSTVARFDSVMNSLPANIQILLGPGIFHTQGYADGVAGGWQPKTRMQITGSGTGVTTLRLVNAADDGTHYFAVGHALTTAGAPNPLDFCVVSDLAIDCDLSGGSNSALSAFGAVRLFGNHVRVNRVKAIHWGTKDEGLPCLVISVITANRTAGLAEVVDPGIDACLVTDPDPANVGPATALHAGGIDDELAEVELTRFDGHLGEAGRMGLFS